MWFFQSGSGSLVGAVLAGLTVAGCASQHDQMVQQGVPVSYADGFADGCESGKKAAGAMFNEFKKDVVRFEKDHRYAQGWSDGHRQCESEEEALQRQIRLNIEAQHFQQHHYDRIGKEALKGVDTSNFKYLK